MRSDCIECSVWTNRNNLWSLKVLTPLGLQCPSLSATDATVALMLDEVEVGATFAKVTFWSGGRPAFVQKEIGAYVQRHGLKPGDHVWLRVIEPGTEFVIERSPG